MSDYDRPAHAYVACCDRMPLFERTERIWVSNYGWERVCRPGTGCQWIDPEGSRP